MSLPDFPEFVWIWCRRQGLDMPTLHVRMARALAAAWRRGEREILLLAFRSAGKSTIAGLFCAWLLAGDPNLRILVLAADGALAGKMVRNVKRIIERHPFTRRLRPRRADQWAADRFTVARGMELRDPSMLARGIGANITGSRADVVICDDVEVPDTCETAGRRADLRARLGELDYVLVPGGLQVYLGTPHSYYTIYADAPRPEAGETRPFLDGFHRIEIPLLDAEGRCAWPERFPPARIEAIRRRTGPLKFESQMLLRPVDAKANRLDPARLRPYDDELEYREGNREAVLRLAGRRLVSASCWWDPSFGARGTGDASVVAAVFTDEEGDYWLHRIRYMTHDPDEAADVDEATQLCRQVVDFVRALHLPAVTLETNGIGRFLPGLLRRELARARVPAAVVEATSRRPKHVRITEAFDAVLAAGALHAHRSVWATPFVAEMREWRPDGRGRDDGLDAVAGCLAGEPVRLSRLPAPARRDWRPGATVFDAAADFAV